MHRRSFLTSLTAGGLGLATSGALPAPRRDAPNFLVILADDLGYSDIGCFGGEIETPHIDRLAKNGLRFTQMHNTAKCFPSRASLLTGLWFQRTDREFPGTATVGEVLRPAGYRTLWSGKNHASFNPRTRGFDRYFGMLGGAGNFFNPGLEAAPGGPKPAQKGTNPWAVDDVETKHFVPQDTKFHATDAFTNYALEWLDEYKGESKPFFLYVANTAPHWPLHAWPEDIAKFEGRYDVGYEVIRDARYKRQIDSGLFDPKLAPLPEPENGHITWDSLSAEDKRLESQRMAVYAAMIHQLDRNIGRLIAKLEKLGKLDNTLILFLSDNGASPERPKAAYVDPNAPMGSVATFESIGRSWAMAANTPMRKAKGSSWEGGNCTPMVVHWPNAITNKGAICRQPAHLVDILPTVIELTGATYPKTMNGAPIPPMDGASLVPAFTGKSIKRTKPLFWQWGSGSAMREGKWKIVRMRTDPWELYDLDANRTETVNLAEQHPERVKQMGAAWDAWYRECAGKAYGAKPEQAPRKKKE